MLKKCSLIATVFIALFGINTSVLATIWHIDTTGVEGDSLQAAIDSAWQSPGIDTVLVQDGIYHLFINDTLGLIMRDSVVLMSENGASACTLTAISEDASDTAWHVIYCNFGNRLSREAAISGFTIKDGNAVGPYPHNYGGGIFIKQASPVLKDNFIIDNHAAVCGGGFYMDYSSSIIVNNVIKNNRASVGGGFYMSDASPILTRNIITDNYASSYGGAFYLQFYSAPIITNNLISSNSSYWSGGALISTDNTAPELIKCVLSDNISYDGGAIYSTSNARVKIDSCFILDNGNTHDFKSGLAYLNSATDTFKIELSHMYYNTMQPDTEILNKSTITMPLENNFWWVTDSASIDLQIDGPADFMPFENDFIIGVPGEPITIDSVRNYNDTTYLTTCDSIWQPDTLCLRIYGEDRNASIQEAAVAILKSSIYPGGIAVALIETDTNSGIYQGKAYVLKSFGNDTIRLDDIYQKIKVDSMGDIIKICANTDTGKSYSVLYKPPLFPDIVLSDTAHDFDSVSVGDTTSWVLYVKNVGNANLIIDSLTTNNSIFDVVSPTFPQTVIAGDSIDVLINCFPPDTGSYEGILSVYSNDPDDSLLTVSLYSYGYTGIGTQKPLSKIKFELFQNTPNPFNKATIIRYAVPEKDWVRIDVYDITGRLLMNLVDRVQKPGYYQIEWDGKDGMGRIFPQGIYFYTIKTGNRSATRKTIIVR